MLSHDQPQILQLDIIIFAVAVDHSASYVGQCLCAHPWPRVCTELSWCRISLVQHAHIHYMEAHKRGDCLHLPSAGSPSGSAGTGPRCSWSRPRGRPRSGWPHGESPWTASQSPSAPSPPCLPTVQNTHTHTSGSGLCSHNNNDCLTVIYGTPSRESLRRLQWPGDVHIYHTHKHMSTCMYTTACMHTYPPTPIPAAHTEPRTHTLQTEALLVIGWWKRWRLQICRTWKHACTQLHQAQVPPPPHPPQTHAL